MTNYKILITSLSLVFFSNILLAKDSKGHPLFPTPEGFVIKGEVAPSKFGIFDNNESTYFCNKLPCTSKVDSTFNENGKITAEGTITKVNYKIANSKPFSSLQIIKSYENVIKDLGGKRLTDSRDGVANLFVIQKPNSKLLVDVYPSENDGFTLTVVENGGFVQIVTAGQLSDQINKQGFANLNVNFDTNKAVIKDGDKAAINEVVTLLKNDPKLKLSVEGHTDNVGAAAANKSLSQARSDSLVAYIAAAGISANRLSAKGFGSEVPVADNRTDEGKAKNRRVELVKIK
jgi:OmpA-OmpF porin, OOP family